jgi:hypothetical protein
MTLIIGLALIFIALLYGTTYGGEPFTVNDRTATTLFIAGLFCVAWSVFVMLGDLL